MAWTKANSGLPRSLMLWPAKEFQTFARPALDVHAIICAMATATGVFLSDPMIPKDSSWCLDLLVRDVEQDWRTYPRPSFSSSLAIQCDNTSKEVKNNTTLRGLAYVFANLTDFFLQRLRSLSFRITHAKTLIAPRFAPLFATAVLEDQERVPHA